MSGPGNTWAWRRPIEDSIAKFVLCYLGENAPATTWVAIATVAQIAKATGQTERNIQRKLRHLEEQGYIEVIVNKRDGERQRANDYRLLVDPDERKLLEPHRPAPPAKKPAEIRPLEPEEDASMGD